VTCRACTKSMLPSQLLFLISHRLAQRFPPAEKHRKRPHRRKDGHWCCGRQTNKLRISSLPSGAHACKKPSGGVSGSRQANHVQKRHDRRVLTAHLHRFDATSRRLSPFSQLYIGSNTHCRLITLTQIHMHVASLSHGTDCLGKLLPVYSSCRAAII
jgi:hypothetical protein